MALSKVDYNSLNVTAAASKALKWNSSADGFETGNVAGAMVLLETITASTSDLVTFDSNIDSTYAEYIFKFISVHPGNNNVITGSIFVGNSIGSGVEIAGVNSAYIRSIGYKGFTSGSAGSGSGFMFWSGSVLSNITNDYSTGGVGLELMQDSSSYFRYRTNPAELDIRTNKFFLGGPSAYVCGSNGNIEITSSNFWLDNDGDV